MSYVSFNPANSARLDFSMNREYLRTNQAGTYMSSALNGCNTRKYHGLLVCQVDSLGGGRHVLLSSVNESISVKGSTFNLSVRRYAGNHIEPRGSKYITEADFGKIIKVTYRIGNLSLDKELMLVEKQEKLLIKYTLQESPALARMQIRPFLAFRNIHQLSRCNLYAQTHFGDEPNGISLCLYDGYPRLFMQFSKIPEFVAAPDWYYNFEYPKEMDRGYEGLEDLYTPGVFEFDLKEKESVVFSAATGRSDPRSLKRMFRGETSRHKSYDSLTGSLEKAACQFVQFREGSAADIVAGYHWYGSITRQTLIALPGLHLAFPNRRQAYEILLSHLPYLENGVFPSSISAGVPVYHSADASLWYIWVIQKLKKSGMRVKEFNPALCKAVKEILENYRSGTKAASMLENGLLFAVEPGVAFTWMDSYSSGNPLVPRYGKPVELNALWFNAVCFGMELAYQEKDSDFVEKWGEFPSMIGKSFLTAFWDEEKGYLADVENGLYTDWSVRPNMVIAAAMPYSPLSREHKEKILGVAKHQLLTPRGLRSLSPEDPAYLGDIVDLPGQREVAAHNGAVYPWLIQFFAEAWLHVYKKNGLPLVKNLIRGFESEMREGCLGSIPEMYNGTPPQAGKGAVSQAWNVAALLYTIHLCTETEKEKLMTEA